MIVTLTVALLLGFQFVVVIAAVVARIIANPAAGLVDHTSAGDGTEKVVVIMVARVLLHVSGREIKE